MFFLIQLYSAPFAKVFFCGSTSSPRPKNLNNFNLSPFTLSLSKGKLRTFARSCSNFLCRHLTCFVALCSLWLIPNQKQRKVRGSKFEDVASLLNRKGFTLIELMVVIVILGILAGLVLPRFMGRTEEARRTKAKLQTETLESALNIYKLDNGAYPSTQQGLEALVQKPATGVIPKNWREGGYLEKGQIPQDPWERHYVYISPGEKT